jgi:hypothetical protein
VRTSNGAVLSGYLGGSDAAPEALAKFALLYADQTEKDHADFLKGMKGAPKRAAKSSTKETVMRKSAPNKVAKPAKAAKKVGAMPKKAVRKKVVRKAKATVKKP